MGRLSRLAASVLTIGALVAVVGVDVAADFAAMSCCVATNYGCNGMRTPDDCCRAMHHLAPRPSTSATAVQVLHAPLIAPTTVAFTLPLVFTSAIRQDNSLARQHDPPHLHTFALLI